MIFYLVTEGHSLTINKYLTSWGKALAPKMRTIYYEELPYRTHLPGGTYIFSDIERLSVDQKKVAAQVWQELSMARPTNRLINHPTQSMRRYELLRTLYEQGQNQFNVYRLTELRQPQRFPVFIRGENDHLGSLTGLLHTPIELEAAIATIYDSGLSRDDKLIVEFCDTSDTTGMFRKYSAFIVGDRIIPRHIFFSQEWLVKAPDNVEEFALQEERQYVNENPHEAELRHIFALARIQYGRIDYSFFNGKIQVWEINTNPMSLGEIRPDSRIQVPRIPQTKVFAPKFNQAFEAIDALQKHPAPIPISARWLSAERQTLWKRLERSLRTLTYPFPQQQHLVEKKLRNTQKTVREFKAKWRRELTSP